MTIGFQEKCHNLNAKRWNQHSVEFKMTLKNEFRFVVLTFYTINIVFSTKFSTRQSFQTTKYVNFIIIKTLWI
jgi:hypothetical protein